MRRSDVKTILQYAAAIPDMRRALLDDLAHLTVVPRPAPAADGMPRSSSPGRPTEVAALHIADRVDALRVRLDVLQRDADTVQSCVDALHPLYRRVLRLRYTRRMTWPQLALAVHLPDSSARHAHSLALNRLADAFVFVPMVDELLQRARDASL